MNSTEATEPGQPLLRIFPTDIGRSDSTKSQRLAAATILSNQGKTSQICIAICKYNFSYALFKEIWSTSESKPDENLIAAQQRNLITKTCGHHLNKI